MARILSTTRMVEHDQNGNDRKYRKVGKYSKDGKDIKDDSYRKDGRL